MQRKQFNRIFIGWLMMMGGRHPSSSAKLALPTFPRVICYCWHLHHGRGADFAPLPGKVLIETPLP